ncbi:hypothetical protein LXA43DRAFT_519293 [Ganoderma leucocontextum]|nr:hypothetical protein LXA43DRAFT_519293 [Ganoderma leucocontextum]
MSDSTPQEHPTALPPITTASYPFDKANADIIIRTSDHVDFHVYSQILIAASPFFEGMFDVPQPPLDQQQLKYGRPIIDVSETSKALDPLLRICYPINKPKGRSLEEIELALAAAMKFEMELPTTVLTEELYTLSKYGHPLEVWGIACRLRLESVARAAGQALLVSPLDFTVLKGMEGITAADYFRLREYVRLLGNVPLAFKFLSPGTLPKLCRSLSSTITSHCLVDAPPPDILCRSADGVEFRAHKTVLSVVSAALREKVSSASSAPPDKDTSGEFISTLPVVHFEEEGAVLHAMLQLSYRCPTNVPLPSDLAVLTAVLGTIEKYGLYSAQPVVWSFWQAIAFANPLRAYCSAIRAGHTLGAKEAARCVLNHVIDGVYVEELEGTPALAYHRLLNYYEKCRRVARQELTKITNSVNVPPRPADDSLPAPDPSSSLEGGLIKKKKGAKRRTVEPPIWAASPTPNLPWLLRYLRDLSSRVQSRPGSVTPGLSDLLNEATKAGSEDSDKGPGVWCEECQIVAEEILKASKALQQLPGDLSKVELEI